MPEKKLRIGGFTGRSRWSTWGDREIAGNLVRISGFPHVVVGIPGGSRTAVSAARHFFSAPVRHQLRAPSHPIIGCLKDPANVGPNFSSSVFFFSCYFFNKEIIQSFDGFDEYWQHLSHQISLFFIGVVYIYKYFFFKDIVIYKYMTRLEVVIKYQTWNIGTVVSFSSKDKMAFLLALSFLIFLIFISYIIIHLLM